MKINGLNVRKALEGVRTIDLDELIARGEGEHADLCVDIYGALWSLSWHNPFMQSLNKGGEPTTMKIANRMLVEWSKATGYRRDGIGDE